MNLKLVWDKTKCSVELDGLNVVAAPLAYPPFECQAMVEEQDTHLVLGQQRELSEPDKPAWYLAHMMDQDIGHVLGTIIIRDNNPPRLLAIIHDLDQEPSCQKDSIRMAYQNLLQIAEEKDLNSIAMPLLGTEHGKLPEAQALQLLNEAILDSCPPQLQRLWLIMPEDSDCSMVSQLEP